MKAFILAAGFGKRMGKYCENLPKPLLPVGGYPLIYYTLFNLKCWGITSVTVNLHYLPDKLKAALYQFPYFQIEYSFEEKILETAGRTRSVRRRRWRTYPRQARWAGHQPPAPGRATSSRIMARPMMGFVFRTVRATGSPAT